MNKPEKERIKRALPRKESKADLQNCILNNELVQSVYFSIFSWKFADFVTGYGVYPLFVQPHFSSSMRYTGSKAGKRDPKWPSKPVGMR